jgi:hypothetical protein
MHETADATFLTALKQCSDPVYMDAAGRLSRAVLQRAGTVHDRIDSIQ